MLVVLPTPPPRQLGTVAPTAPARSAMLPGVFINSDSSRQAYVADTMVNQ